VELSGLNKLKYIYHMQLKAKINGSKEIYLPGKKGKVSSTAMLNNLLTNSENA